MTEPIQPREPGFEVTRHYLKDLSFESPSGPLTEEQLAEVELNRDISVSIATMPGGGYAVSLYLLATGTRAGHTIILCEMTYMVEVRLHLIPDLVAPQILAVNVPTTMLPQLNSILSLNSIFGGYPPIALDEIDFMRVYQETTGGAAMPPAAVPPGA